MPPARYNSKHTAYDRNHYSSLVDKNICHNTNLQQNRLFLYLAISITHLYHFFFLLIVIFIYE